MLVCATSKVFQPASLALICLKNETKADAEQDLRDLVSAAGADVAVVGASRNATAPPGICGESAPAELAKYSLDELELLLRRWTLSTDIPIQICRPVKSRFLTLISSKGSPLEILQDPLKFYIG